MKALTAHEAKARDDLQALMDQHGVNWGSLLSIFSTILTILGPILGGLGGTKPPAPPVTPAP